MIATIPAPFALVRPIPGGGVLLAVTNMGYPLAPEDAAPAEAAGLIYRSGPNLWLPTWLGTVATQPYLVAALSPSRN